MDLSRLGGWGVCVTILGLLVYFVGPLIKKTWLLPLRLAGLLLVALGALGTMNVI